MADILDGIIISEVLADNAGGAAIDTDGDGNTNKADEFIEIQNTTGVPISLDGFEIWSEKQGLLYSFGAGDTIAADSTATVVGNYTGTPPAGFFDGGAAENSNWLPDGEGNKFDTIFLVNTATGEFVTLSYGNPPRTPTEPSGFPGTTQVGTGETIDSNAPNGTAFVRDANGNFVEGTPNPGTPGVVCFVAGTLIDTEFGPRAVETLKPGTRIMTRDEGLAPLLGLRHLRLGRLQLARDRSLAPVEIPANLLGAHDALSVSPAHRIMVAGPRPEMLFGMSEVLIAARHFVDHGAKVKPANATQYVHLLFSDHHIVRSGGLWSESLHLADAAFSAASQAHAWDLAPGLDLKTLDHGPTARRVLKAWEAEVLFGGARAQAA